MGFAGVSLLGKLVSRIKYGKQIGDMNRNFQLCYGRTKGCRTTYTVVDAKTGNQVMTKVRNNMRDGGFDYNVLDAKGNIIEKGGQYVTPIGITSNHSRAYEIRNIRREKNVFGQVTHSSDITFRPDSVNASATVCRNVDGNLSKTYLNTATGEHHTIYCSA